MAAALKLLKVKEYTDLNGNYVGPARVWLGSESVPGLAMARAFGDSVAAEAGVIAEPGNF